LLPLSTTAPPEWIRPKPQPQYIPDVVENRLALAAVVTPPFAAPISIFDVRKAPQYVPEQGTNKLALAVGPPVPFVAPISIFDAAPYRPQFVPDLVENTLHTTRALIPFFARATEPGPLAKPSFIPDAVENLLSLTAPPPPFVPWQSEPPAPPIRRYVPDVLSNPVALGVKPGTEVLIERQTQAPDWIKPRPPQHVPDILLNPRLPTPGPVSFGGPAPFQDMPRGWKQFVPDTLAGNSFRMSWTIRSFRPGTIRSLRRS
jgi:hypothetical protein